MPVSVTVQLNNVLLPLKTFAFVFSRYNSHVPLPDPVEESSLQDPSVQSPMVEGPVHVTYEIVADGTKRRREKLVDSLGYAYNVKER